ncbi:MAG TPA: VOC family protein [Solirubrobacteraceae bacterium]|nr:VOC family protein [Solirubrobacteraceae bacterium]
MTISTSLVTGVDFVCLPTQDLDAAREFYGTVLGLEAGGVWQRGDAPARGAEFQAGNLTLSVVDPSAIGIEFQATKVPVALHVEDIEAARAELETRGVSFFGDTMDTGVCFMAPFSDPDGNALMLHHRYAPRT